MNENSHSSAINNNLRVYFDAIPKIELHLHLEGAIPFETLFNLIKKYGGDTQVPNIASLKEHFVYQDFPQFLETWNWKNQFIREYEDFTYIVEETAKDLYKQNIRYVEAFYSPADVMAQGLKPQEVTVAIRQGLDKVPGIKINLITDLVRNVPPEMANRIVDEISEVKNYGVIGIGLGGAEQKFPAEIFTAAYEKAAKAGFHLTAHAGEASGAGSIWSAIRNLKVERIGHGTRAEEDPALVEYLLEHQLPLEMCPISNVKTKVVSSIERHPIREYFKKGIQVTVNTDDPKMFGNSLTDEYCALSEKLGFSIAEIHQVICNAINGSWLEIQDKEKLNEEFRKEFALMGMVSAKGEFINKGLR